MALSMQSATLAGKQITSAKVSSKRYVGDRALEPLGELRFSFFFYSALLFFFVHHHQYFVLFCFWGRDECLSANKPLRRALAIALSSPFDTVRSTRRSKRPTCRRSSPRRPSPRPPPPRCSHRCVLCFSLFSLFLKGGFW